MDENEKVIFECSNGCCDYKLCAPCIKESFKEADGTNSSTCLMCGTPTAIKMIESACGIGAIKAIERNVRYSVEFEYKEEMSKKQYSMSQLKEDKTRARKLFNELAELLLMKCPRCKNAFYDYDGCNALTCASCAAGICAICLADCGNDAHEHVRNLHGDLFDKKMFLTAREKRESETVQMFLSDLQDESEELILMVKNHAEKAGARSAEKHGQNDLQNYKVDRFLNRLISSLQSAIKTDRLSILQDGDNQEWMQYGLSIADISPRCAIPPSYRLCLIGTDQDFVYAISIEKFRMIRRISNNVWKDESHWEKIDLVTLAEEVSSGQDVKVDVLENLGYSLQRAVVAIEGEKKLYQTRAKRVNGENHHLNITFSSVSTDGALNEDIVSFNDDNIPFNTRIIGLNANHRFMTLQRHVEEVKDKNVLIPRPLEQLIGARPIEPIATDLERPVPDTLNSLNKMQEHIAHPLKMKTAMEVAGPPGTGKTKTILELVRSILQCTSYNIILLSERNGAIEAIAETFANACLLLKDIKKLEKIQVVDYPTWSSLVAYGSNSIGPSTKLFTWGIKIR